MRFSLHVQAGLSSIIILIYPGIPVSPFMFGHEPNGRRLGQYLPVRIESQLPGPKMK